MLATTATTILIVLLSPPWEGVGGVKVPETRNNAVRTDNAPQRTQD